MKPSKSRMREIRTYGLMRGRWPVRLARRAGVYSTALGDLAVTPLRCRQEAAAFRGA